MRQKLNELSKMIGSCITRAEKLSMFDVVEILDDCANSVVCAIEAAEEFEENYTSSVNGD